MESYAKVLRFEKPTGFAGRRFRAFQSPEIIPLYEETYENVPEFCYSASFEEVKEKGFTLVPSRYIEFVNRDENIDFDTKMKSLQGELKELLVQEEKSKSDLLAVFKELGYEIVL